MFFPQVSLILAANAHSFSYIAEDSTIEIGIGREREEVMLKEESGGSGGGVVNNWARVCDTCRAAACTVYCRADSAYLCAGCDGRVHAANRVASRHERVRVCEACERAPAALLCKADAASLCTACDADIHSANPLARRHQRVPILPISGCLYGTQGGPAAGDTEDQFMTQEGEETIGEEDEDEAASWLLLNPAKNSNNQSNNGFLFGGEVDEYLDIVEYNSCAENQYSDQYNQQHYSVPPKSCGGDSVVPIQYGEGKDHQQQQQQQYHNFQLGLEYEPAKAAYSYDGSASQGVSTTHCRIYHKFWYSQKFYHSIFSLTVLSSNKFMLRSLGNISSPQPILS